MCNEESTAYARRQMVFYNGQERRLNKKPALDDETSRAGIHSCR